MLAEKLRVILRSGADPNFVDRHADGRERSLLRSAIEERDWDCVLLLLQCGADVEDAEIFNHLFLTEGGRDHEQKPAPAGVLKMLVDVGMRRNRLKTTHSSSSSGDDAVSSCSWETMLHCALRIASGAGGDTSLALAREVLSHHDPASSSAVFALDSRGRPAFFCATSLSAVKLLLRGPRWRSADAGTTGIIEKLLDPGVTDANGLNWLHYLTDPAAFLYLVEQHMGVELLLEQEHQERGGGPRPDIIDNPIQHAARRGLWELCDVYLTHAARSLPTTRRHASTSSLSTLPAIARPASAPNMLPCWIAVARRGRYALAARLWWFEKKQSKTHWESWLVISFALAFAFFLGHALWGFVLKERTAFWARYLCFLEVVVLAVFAIAVLLFA